MSRHRFPYPFRFWTRQVIRRFDPGSEISAPTMGCRPCFLQLFKNIHRPYKLSLSVSASPLNPSFLALWQRLSGKTYLPERIVGTNTKSKHVTVIERLTPFIKRRKKKLPFTTKGITVIKKRIFDQYQCYHCQNVCGYYPWRSRFFSLAPPLFAAVKSESCGDSRSNLSHTKRHDLIRVRLCQQRLRAKRARLCNKNSDDVPVLWLACRTISVPSL